jgi:CAAX protease family protein
MAGSPASLVRLWRSFFAEPWLAIAREGDAERAALGGALDARPVWMLIVCALVMVFQEYFGDRPFFAASFPMLARGSSGQLFEFAWWSGAKVFGYLVVPVIALRAAGIPLGDCGFRWRGTSLRIYLWLFLAVMPLVVAASFTRSFQQTYPFYRLAARSYPDLLAWELMYGGSFFALEFFFRGFLLFPLRRSFGPFAIVVMDVPYCMIHFHKPLAEVVGAIGAGIVLGTLALRTRSILGGVLLHVAVAWSMDLLSLWHQGAFPIGRWIG